MCCVTQVAKSQRQHMLYEQLNAIKKELGIQKDDKSALLEKFKARLADVTLEPAVKVRMTMIVLRRVMTMIVLMLMMSIQQAIDEEMNKLEFLEPNSAEFKFVFAISALAP